MPVVMRHLSSPQRLVPGEEHQIWLPVGNFPSAFTYHDRKLTQVLADLTNSKVEELRLEFHVRGQQEIQRPEMVSIPAKR